MHSIFKMTPVLGFVIACHGPETEPSPSGESQLAINGAVDSKAVEYGHARIVSLKQQSDDLSRQIATYSKSSGDPAIVAALGGELARLQELQSLDPKAPLAYAAVDPVAILAINSRGWAPDDICAEPASPADCCRVGETVTQGQNPADYIVHQWDPTPRCILARGGADYIVSGTGNDRLEGGADADFLLSGDGDDVVRGRGGSDYINAGSRNNVVHGGAGDDAIFMLGAGVDRIYGGAGADDIYTGTGVSFSVPGPGQDEFYGGSAVDTVVVYDPCEFAPGEYLDGGAGGDDTLVIPVAFADLASYGVTAVNFETVKVVANPCFSECANHDACLETDEPWGDDHPIKPRNGHTLNDVVQSSGGPILAARCGAVYAVSASGGMA